jgi:hypothetical protein
VALLTPETFLQEVLQQIRLIVELVATLAQIEIIIIVVEVHVVIVEHILDQVETAIVVEVHPPFMEVVETIGVLLMVDLAAAQEAAAPWEGLLLQVEILAPLIGLLALVEAQAPLAEVLAVDPLLLVQEAQEEVVNRLVVPSKSGTFFISKYIISQKF